MRTILPSGRNTSIALPNFVEKAAMRLSCVSISHRLPREPRLGYLDRRSLPLRHRRHHASHLLDEIGRRHTRDTDQIKRLLDQRQPDTAHAPEDLQRLRPIQMLNSREQQHRDGERLAGFDFVWGTCALRVVSDRLNAARVSKENRSILTLPISGVFAQYQVRPICSGGEHEQTRYRSNPATLQARTTAIGAAHRRVARGACPTAGTATDCRQRACPRDACVLSHSGCPAHHCTQPPHPVPTHRSRSLPSSRASRRPRLRMVTWRASGMGGGP